MQTFLPYKDLARSARCLDSRRLGKQRIEGWQILSSLLGLRYDDATQSLVASVRKGWANHPAVLQWAGHEWLLVEYLEEIIKEWARRGYSNERMGLFMRALYENKLAIQRLIDTRGLVPTWFGRIDFHRSHRSNLLRKEPAYYGKFKWKVPNDLHYIWPSHEGVK